MSQSGSLKIIDSNLPSDVPTQFVTDSGTAVPIAHVLFVNGAGTATTSVGASNQIIVTAVGSGDVVGPAIAVSGNFASFNGSSGKIIQDSGFTDSSFFKVSNNLSEGNAATMRSNLGLGTLAVLNSPLGATNGGTSQNTYVSGDILYASAANTLSRLAKSTDGKVLTLAAGLPSWVTPSGGTVTSVSGTLNRITSTGGTTPVIDISASYVGQSSITTLGTIGTGTWQGSVIGGTYGGTGVNNGASTLTLGGSLTTSGAFASTFTMTAGTSVTFPTSGTLATTAQLPSLPLSPASGGTGIANNSASTLTISGNFASTFTVTNTTSVTFPTSGTLATTAQLPSLPLSAASGGTGIANNAASTLTISGNFATTLTVTNTTSVTLPTSGTLATTSQIPSLPLSLANGGTNANLTASNGGIFYSTSTAGAILAGTATAGQILRSGASTTPAWSTATYPATAGTSGNVLTSDGTNWTSSAAPGGGILTATKTLTSSQIKSLRATPIEIVAAPGSGKFIVLMQAAVKFLYGGTNVFVAGASQTIALGPSTSLVNATICSNAQIVASASSFSRITSADTTNSALANYDNQHLIAYNTQATEISGNAAGDNSIIIWCQYWIFTP